VLFSRDKKNTSLDPSSPLLIVGLGNPGNEYHSQRHNLGFLCLDEIADMYAFPLFKPRFKGLWSEGSVKDHKIFLLKPQTYMNLSGQSVQQAAQFYKIPPSHILVLHDELDLNPCEVRFKQGGGNAGHNGLKSIDSQVGNAFGRLRIGIGRPQDKARVASYVLENIPKSEWDSFSKVLEEIAEALPDIIEAVLHQKSFSFASKS